MKSNRFRLRYLSAGQQGFSLLEMIAALTILTIGSVVLFSWLGQTMGQLTRFQLQETESMARIQAVQFLSNQNPAATPAGKQIFDQFYLEWTSAAVSETRESVLQDGLGLYQITLYNVQSKAFHHDGREWFAFSVKLAGYKQVRNPTADKPF
jgi:prepilin-type N-terminal cleavage/methylation domain-containing protein